MVGLDCIAAEIEAPFGALAASCCTLSAELSSSGPTLSTAQPKEYAEDLIRTTSRVLQLFCKVRHAHHIFEVDK